MVAGRPRLGCILIDNGCITEEQLDSAVQHQVSTGCRLGEALIALEFCTDAQIARALAEQLEVPFVDLHATPPAPECIALLPREVALWYGVLPVRMQGGRLLVAALDPYDIRLDEAVRRATQHHIALAVAPQSQLSELLHLHYAEHVVEPSAPLDDPEALDPERQTLSPEDLIAAGEQPSAIRTVNMLIADAMRRGASDIHIEPESDRIRIRYRIDGRLCPAQSLPREQLLSLVSRVKVMCGMDISENRRPQDGGDSLTVDGQRVELRVSTLPGINGEIVVLRLLGQGSTLQTLDSLGFPPATLRHFRRLLSARQGVILITGPTGSGKTTSLYAALSHLNSEDIKIITVEDPVEIKLPGVNQIQVHDRAGRSFASTLRSMLRQDPDVIMVGEIRDAETAEICFRAALTGHMVLSTLHTQHTLGTVARLIDMGVAPWLVAACLKGVIAQRLVRRVCQACGEEYTPPAGLRQALKDQFGSLDAARFRKGRGCPACHQTGSRGRTGVYELLVLDEEAGDLLARERGTRRLREYVLKHGFRSMEEDAFRKACRGLIEPEEVINLGFGAAMKQADVETQDWST